jgi:glycosyltransferase involved in cell wall biosynthesis
VTRPVLGSVVIPAHNEAATIGRGLAALSSAFDAGELEVVVVCNGCTDETADVARRSRLCGRVIEMGDASKPRALREGDRHARAFPRMYLDADVVLPGASARAVLERLHRGGVLAARPPIRYAVSHSDHLVKRYYRARAQMPSVMSSLWGAGAYALSAEGRCRFGEFPDLIADDLFVDRCFDRAEIEIVDCPPVIVRAPRTAHDLIRVLRRTYRGQSEQRGLPGHRSGSRLPMTLHDLARHSLVPSSRALDGVAYASLALSARVALRLTSGSPWERDDASRMIGDE